MVLTLKQFNLVYNLIYRNDSSIIYSGDAQNQQTQKMQNLTERNENGAQKKARFYFLLLIFLKNKIYEGLF